MLPLLNFVKVLTSSTSSYTGLLAQYIKGSLLSTLLQEQLLHNPMVSGSENETQCDWT